VQKKFVTNLALLLLLNLLIKPFWIFGIDRTVQNTLPEDYGMYFVLFNFSLLFNIILDLGITNFNNKHITQNNNLLTKYFSGITVFKMMLFVIYLIITFGVGWVMGYDSERFFVLLFLAINQFLVSFIQYLRSNITALQFYKTDSFLSVLDKTLMIAFCAILLWGNVFDFSFTIMHFIYAQTLAYAITAIIVFSIVISKTIHFIFTIDGPFLKQILKQTFPYALLVLTMVFYYRIDAVMLDLMLTDGERQVAIYAQAYRFMDAFNQFGVLFAGLLLPMFAFLIKDNKTVAPLVKLSFSLLFVLSVTIAGFMFYHAREVMDLLYDFDTQFSSNVLIVLMFCYVFIATSYIFGTLLTANGSLKLLNKIAVVGLVINVLLNLWLIPQHHAVGAAIASLVTQAVIIIAQVIVSKNIFNFKLDVSFLVRISLFALIIFGTFFGIKELQLNLLIHLLIAAMIGLIVGLLLKVIDLKGIWLILKNKVE
jgi:O-antigen/teichoic acid export membrane protein